MSDLTECFSTKIKSLKDFHQRLSIPSTNVPSGLDICETLKYFKNHFIGTFQNSASCVAPSSSDRSTFNSSLNYFELYDVSMLLMNRLTQINTGREDVANMLLECLSLNLFFLDEYTCIDLPAAMTQVLHELDASFLLVQECVFKGLCWRIIPMCFGNVKKNGNFQNLASEYYSDIPSLISVILECVPNVSFHYELVEMLMLFKNDLWMDVMSVVMFSDGLARVYATQLLFHYWPHLHSSPSMEHKVEPEHEVEPKHLYEALICGSDECKNPAVKMVTDPILVAQISGKAPPLYLCRACAQRSIKDEEYVLFHDILLPMEHIGYNCENRHCIAKDSTATVTICSSECQRRLKVANLNGDVSQLERCNFSWHLLENRSVRYCAECYRNVSLVLGDLANQHSPPCAWEAPDSKITQIIVDTVISLLLDPAVDISGNAESRKNSPLGKTDFNLAGDGSCILGAYPCGGCKKNMGVFKHLQTLSHFGIWLLLSLCPPHEKIEKAQAKQLIAAVLSWYGKNACVHSDEIGSRLEKLKEQCLQKWLQEMCSLHFNSFLSVLLPNPSPDCRVKGHWDLIKPLWRHYYSALSLITCLSSYSIISADMWKCLIPTWMIAIVKNISSVELKQLLPVLNSLFDSSLSPLPFKPDVTFDFAFQPFKSSSLYAHEQSLHWLQILCEVDVLVPLSLLLNAFNHADFNLCSASNTKEKDHADSTLLFGCNTVLSDDMKKQILKQVHQSCTHTLSSLFEAMNVKCTGTCLNQNMAQPAANNDGDEHPDTVQEKESVFTRKVVCYVKVLDVMYKQMVLHDYQKHKGFYFGEAIEIIRLLNTLLKHVIHMSQMRPDHHEAFALENRWPRSQEMFRRFYEFYHRILAHIVNDEVPEGLDSYFNPDWNDSPTEEDVFGDSLDELELHTTEFDHLPLPIQLFFRLVQVLDNLPGTAQADYHLVKSISLLGLNGGVLNALLEVAQPCMKTFEKQLLFPALWKHLKQSLNAYHVVPLLCRGLAASRSGFVTVMTILDACFTTSGELSSNITHLDEWSPAFESIHRIQSLLIFTDMSLVQTRSALSHVISYSVCLLLRALDEVNAAVYSKSRSVLDSLSPDNYQVIYHCLRHEFDSSVDDRVFILSQLHLLNKLRPDLTGLYESFLLHSVKLMKKGTSILRGSTRQNFSDRTSNLGSRSADGNRSSQLGRGSRNVDCFVKLSDRIAPSSFYGKFDNGDGTVPRRAKSWSSPDPDADQYFGCLTTEADSASGLVSNRETVRCLVFGICKYVIDCGQSSEGKPASKTFHELLLTMLGFKSPTYCFSGTSSMLRKTIGFDTFLLNLPYVMDRNLTFGKEFLLPVIKILELAVSNKPRVRTHGHGQSQPTLEILHVRLQHAWLKTLLVVMYKYQDCESLVREKMNNVISTCLSALESEFHRCTPGSTTIESYSVDDPSPPVARPQRSAAAANRSQSTVYRVTPDHIAVDLRPTVGMATSNKSLNKSTHSLGNFDLPSLSSAIPSTSDVPSFSDGRDMFYVRDEEMWEMEGDLDKMQGVPLIQRATHSTNDLSNICEAVLTEDRPLTADRQSPLLTNRTDSSQTDDCDSALTNEGYVFTRCVRCDAIVNDFDNETLSLCIVNLCQFVRFDPKLAVPLLPRLLKQLALIIEPFVEDNLSSGQAFSKASTRVMLVARQALRCILHQLAKCEIFSCLFLMSLQAGDLFIPVIMHSLKGYQKLNSLDVLDCALKGLPDDLHEFTSCRITSLLSNLSMYLRHLSLHVPSHPWQNVINGFCTFFYKIHNFVSHCNMHSLDDVLDVMMHLLKMRIIVTAKLPLVEPFGKLLCGAIVVCPFSLHSLHSLFSIMVEVLSSKEREKMLVIRGVIAKLISALKQNCPMTDTNLHHLLQNKTARQLHSQISVLVLLDNGSKLSVQTNKNNFASVHAKKVVCYVMESTRPYLEDLLALLGDSDFIVEFPKRTKCTEFPVGAPLKPSTVKLAVAQIVAGHLNKISGASYFPLLATPPSTMQHGAKEYNECISHIRKLSWVLLGALNHLGALQDSATPSDIWRPVSFDAGANIANILQVILTGYLEQNKEHDDTSVTSLHSTFLFCQLWTVYCEHLSSCSSSSSSHISGTSLSHPGLSGSTNQRDEHVTLLLEFWSLITPSMLVLFEQKGMVSDSVHRHIASLVECLQQYDSSILFKLYPVWKSMLTMKPTNAGPLRDIPAKSPTGNTPTSGAAGKVDGSWLAQHSKKKNARQLLSVVDSIKGRLIRIENGEGIYLM